MKRITRTLALLVSLTLALFVGVGAASSASAAPPSAPLTFEGVTGVADDGSTFLGDLTIDSVVREGSKLIATGELTGTLTDATGAVTEVAADITAPLDLAGTSATCDILTLDLGPLFLDLLGLQVDLSAIELDITAVPGAGNLLGNLLCAVAGLLDGPGNPLGAIGNLLDRILGIVGGLLGSVNA